jgi:hypothetical protein
MNQIDINKSDSYYGYKGRCVLEMASNLNVNISNHDFKIPNQVISGTDDLGVIFRNATELSLPPGYYVFNSTLLIARAYSPSWVTNIVEFSMLKNNSFVTTVSTATENLDTSIESNTSIIFNLCYNLYIDSIDDVIEFSILASNLATVLVSDSLNRSQFRIQRIGF